MSFRPPSRSNRPVSGLRNNNRPSTGFRRLDTANGQKPIGSRTVGLDTNVNIENRPITQHGMTGMKTASRAPNRKIADRNYYEDKLKETLIEIVNEIDSMKEKIKTHNADKIEISKLEKERNVVMTDVRQYEGKLADYNLALDKMRSSGTDMMHLQQTTQDIERKNQQEKMRIDAIFLERKNLESQIAEIEDNISMICDEMRGCVEDESEFNKLYTEYQRIDCLISEKEKRLNNIQYRYHEIRENLSSNQYAPHLKAIEIQKQLNELKRHKLELEEETNGSCAMNPDQIKQKILEGVKTDNRILQQTMESSNEMDDKIEELHRIISQKEKDLSAMKQYTKQSHKYQQLFDRDRKMQLFIDQFESNVKTISNEMDQLKADNVGLLRHISQINEGKNGKNQTQMKMNEMRNDISLKKQQKEEAQNTLNYSEKEVEKREMELQKINHLDEKISVELNNIETKTKQFENEMKSFQTHEEIQSEYKERKQKLFQIKMELQQKKESMEKQVLQIAHKSDQINRKLNENAYHNELKEMETKIAKLSQNIFAVEDSVAEYKREGEYQAIAKQIIEMQQETNALLLKELAIEM